MVPDARPQRSLATPFALPPRHEHAASQRQVGPRKEGWKRHDDGDEHGTWESRIIVCVNRCVRPFGAQIPQQMTYFLKRIQLEEKYIKTT